MSFSILSEVDTEKWEFVTLLLNPSVEQHNFPKKKLKFKNPKKRVAYVKKI